MVKTTKKRYYNCGNMINHYFFEHKTLLIAFIGIFILGIVVGVFTYMKFNKVFDLTIITQQTNVNIFVDKIGWFSFAINNFLHSIFNMLIILLLSLTIYIFPLVLLYIGYLGYILGANCVVIIMILGLGGVVSLILFYIPIQLCIYFLMINLACICENRCVNNFKFGKYYKSNGEIGYSLKTFLIMMMIILILCIIMGIILPQSIKNVLNKI